MSQANRVGKQNARERVAAEKIARQRAERRRRQIRSAARGSASSRSPPASASRVRRPSTTAALRRPAAAVVDPQAKSDKATGRPHRLRRRAGEDDRLRGLPLPGLPGRSSRPSSRRTGSTSQDGKLQITYHPARVIDSHDNGTGSLNGANAAACAQDQGQFMPLHDLLYANQPNEQTDPWADKSKILAIADQIPALKASTAFQQLRDRRRRTTAGSSPTPTTSTSWACRARRPSSSTASSCPSPSRPRPRCCSTSRAAGRGLQEGRRQGRHHDHAADRADLGAVPSGGQLLGRRPRRRRPRRGAAPRRAPSVGLLLQRSDPDLVEVLTRHPAD